MTKLFITGTTGYVGGDALYAITHAYPDLEVTALVRSSDKGAKVASQYASIRLVYGDLDSTDLLTSEASKADIVIHAADCDHVASAKAIVAGLSQSQHKTYLIHTSGTGILAYEDSNEATYGIKRDLTFNDWDGIKDVTSSIPDSAIHRNVDKIILAAHSASSNINTAIVCPPCIYGPGRGPDNQRSIQVYDMAKAVLTRHKGFVVGDGENIWTQVHVQDLSDLYVALVTSALEGERGKATWNDQGYYFTENGEFVWGDIAKEIAKIAADKKFVNSAEFDTISKDEAEKLRPFAGYMWGTNSRCKAVRAGKLLGWKPKQKTVQELLGGIVEDEARAIGQKKGHAALAAGEGQLL